jgi:LmbE family N-acetylglucosaminyl deacetylase
MLGLTPEGDAHRPLHLLCIGAHSDDLEIGCGGTLLTWLAGTRPIHVTWVVLSAGGGRAAEDRRSAKALLKRAASVDLVLGEFRDGHLPAEFTAAKAFFESLKPRVRPDLVLTHRLEDRHQDHRQAAELTWNTFRDHLILEYEIFKYEGDLGQPNVFVPLSAAVARRKAAHLERHFGSQRGKHWFDGDNFLALARLRALECRAPDGFAEAFHGRKLVLGAAGGAA